MSAQGLKGGFGFSYYGIDKIDFTDKKGNPYTVEGAGSVTSIQLGASGFINIKILRFIFHQNYIISMEEES